MKRKKVQESKLKSRILTFGIALLFVLFIGYAIETIYPSPQWNDYCPTPPTEVINSEIGCEAAGGTWEQYQKPIVPEGQAGYCDFYKICQEEYDIVQDDYNRTIFFVSLTIGILIFILALLLSVESVSAGFMGGALLLILYGTIRYWGDLSNIWRTLMLALALAILVWIGYKKLH